MSAAFEYTICRHGLDKRLVRCRLCAEDDKDSPRPMTEGERRVMRKAFQRSAQAAKTAGNYGDVRGTFAEDPLRRELADARAENERFRDLLMRTRSLLTRVTTTGSRTGDAALDSLYSMICAALATTQDSTKCGTAPPNAEQENG